MNELNQNKVVIEQTSKKIKLVLLVSTLLLFVCFPMTIMMIASDHSAWALTFAIVCALSFVTNIIARFAAWWGHG
jgi:ABC-type spermidine/putrescine transport system permease subunit I